VKFRADKRQVYLNRLRSKNWLATWPDLKVLPIGWSVSASKFHARFGSLAAIPERPLLADSVEKVGLPQLPDHDWWKRPFLHAATWNPSPDAFAKSKGFNLGRVLFWCANHGRLFQQNRPIAACRRG